MKTQLIPLESHDDLISVRDRMSWAKTPRILLVWPKSERIALRPLDLKILQRHAASLGAQLGLVVRHRNIRREAQALSMPVFNSTGEAQRSPWPEHDLGRKREYHGPRQNLRKIGARVQARVREAAWREHPVARIGIFSFGVLAVLIMASLFIPQARIIITPETEVQTVTLPVQADPSIGSVFITGNIPSRQVSVIVEGSQEADVTGKVPVPLTKSVGEVTFRNLTDEALNIPAGTILTSTGLPGVRFQTTELGELEGGLEATVDVPIQAESAGATGNVDADTILAIEGNLGLLVTVTNAEPTTGGSDRMAEAPTEADLARLRRGLLAELEAQASRQIEGTLAKGDQIFSDTLDVSQIIEETYDPSLGQPSSNVTLSMQVEFSASYVSNEDLSELAGTVLNASLPEGFVAAQTPLEFEPLGPYRTDREGITRWSVQVSRPVEKRVDAGTILPLVQGRSLVAATAQLDRNLDLSTSPEIRLSPNWWPWMPLIPLNITVEMR